MKSIVHLLLLVLLTGAPCFSAPKPRILQAMIGGFSGESYELIYDGRELRYYKAQNMFDLKRVEPEVIAVSDQAWDTLFANLDSVGVWKWKRKYVDSKVVDGTIWSLTIVYDTQQDRSVVAFGSNHYPKDFQRLLSALASLSGGRSFK
jgi:hypothetical protein